MIRLMKPAILIVVALAAYGAAGWLGFWLNRRLELTPLPGPHWRWQLFIYSLRTFIVAALLMVPSVVLLLAIALLS
jgi:hypothetical protein